MIPSTQYSPSASGRVAPTWMAPAIKAYDLAGDARADTQLTQPWRSACRRWYGGRHPSELSTEDFMFLHQTGWIPDGKFKFYRSLQSLQWLGTPLDRPILIDSYRIADRTLECRQSGERLAYCSLDVNGDIRRDERGNAIDMTWEEIQAKDLAPYDRTIVAFDGGMPVGFVSDEWGAVGVWVAVPYQRLGIGTRLVRLYWDADPRSQLGQMTNAGMALARAVHRSYCC
jgi:hypothetical protein